jgi:hypothetical protein
MSTAPKKNHPSSAAANQDYLPANTFEGKFVNMNGDKLLMTNENGKEFSHTLAKDAKLTCDGAVCRAEDLKVGNTIRVSTRKDDHTVATFVESLDKQAAFAKCL